MTGCSAPAETSGSRKMVDPFGRNISYLRVSVTDRCDLRCFYCMSRRIASLKKAGSNNPKIVGLVASQAPRAMFAKCVLAGNTCRMFCIAASKSILLSTATSFGDPEGV